MPSFLPSAAVGLLLLAVPAFSQVHYHPDGRPWNQRANRGPDAEVKGWYYNLGPTGLRAELVADAPTHLVVRHVFEDSPAHRRVKVGDAIVGAGGAAFEVPHRNGYGMKVFGPDGPVLDFARALEAAQTKEGKGRLTLTVLRDGETLDVELRLGRPPGAYAETFPAQCKRTDATRERLLAYLAEQQGEDGSFGNPVHNLYAPLALLASGDREYKKAVERNARFHARTTSAEDDGGLIHWRYMTAGIVLSEYYLATRARWVPEELEEIYAFLCRGQYLGLDQVNPRVKETHPDSWPKNAKQQHGGWGHNPGFEGYGPISMLTGEGALAFALMARCGVDVDRERHDAAYDFLQRGTGRNGYLWYGDSAAGHENWADMGRTGASGLAHAMSPYDGGLYEAFARRHAQVIGRHPESFPDTHGSPILGMGWAAAAAYNEPAAFRSLMDANRWWFLLAECHDGTYYYQPNRDNAGYGADSRKSASAVTAFILSLPLESLAITGGK